MQDSNGNRQIMRPTFFPQIAGCKVDSDPLEWKEEPRILDGSADALAALGYSGVWQSNDDKQGTGTGNVHLDLRECHQDQAQRKK